MIMWTIRFRQLTFGSPDIKVINTIILDKDCSNSSICLRVSVFPSSYSSSSRSSRMSSKSTQHIEWYCIYTSHYTSLRTFTLLSSHHTLSPSPSPWSCVNKRVNWSSMLLLIFWSAILTENKSTQQLYEYGRWSTQHCDVTLTLTLWILKSGQAVQMNARCVA